MRLTKALQAATPLLLSGIVLAATNEPCYGPSGAAGVCITDAACTKAGGKTITGACKADAANIKCCSKPACGSDSPKGNCRWTSDCTDSSIANQCPGPAQMKCCSSAATGFGGYDAPRVPPVGACKRVAVEGAQKIVKAWPGRIREVQCIRDCACPGDSDHCCGLATDMMCSDAGGSATLSGKEIAEWVMRNRKALNLKYVIWGQKIWTVSVDKTEKGWENWRTQNDRNSITKNHWDHVHVSYNG